MFRKYAYPDHLYSGITFKVKLKIENLDPPRSLPWRLSERTTIFAIFPLRSILYRNNYLCDLLRSKVNCIGLDNLLLFFFRRNEPVQPPQIAIASLLGGLSFGVGMIFFLLGMELLSQSISYPLIAMLPGLFVSLWSIFYFEEISVNQNSI